MRFLRWLRDWIFGTEEGEKEAWDWLEMYEEQERRDRKHE